MCLQTSKYGVLHLEHLTTPGKLSNLELNSEINCVKHSSQVKSVFSMQSQLIPTNSSLQSKQTQQRAPFKVAVDDDDDGVSMSQTHTHTSTSTSTDTGSTQISIILFQVEF